MTPIIPMPSPRGTNHERLFMSPLRGAAYDARRGILGYDTQPTRSKACQVADRLVSLLSQDELSELGREVIKARDCKYGAAQDQEATATLDPDATRFGPNGTVQRKAQLNAGGSAMDSARRRRIAQDARWTSALTQAFARPGSPVYDARERRKLAADEATAKSLSERYPGFGAIGVQAAERDSNAGPHSMANDGRLVRSLEERYPDLKKIGFA
jgi:hypothetical protein